MRIRSIGVVVGAFLLWGPWTANASDSELLELAKARFQDQGEPAVFKEFFENVERGADVEQLGADQPITAWAQNLNIHGTERQSLKPSGLFGCVLIPWRQRRCLAAASKSRAQESSDPLI
jgi:hypothetical protein